jgi:hypothetical protein
VDEEQGETFGGSWPIHEDSTLFAGQKNVELVFAHLLEQ